MSKPGPIPCVIQIIDDTTAWGHVLHGVRINGTLVPVAKDGVSIEFGPNEVTKVTLELMPSTVVFSKDVPVEDITARPAESFTTEAVTE